MFRFLLLAFIVVPIVEIYVLAQVADSIGWLNGLALILLISFAGAYLVRKQGFEILRRLQAQIAQGNMPNNELVDGGLVLFAGALLLTPGFVTDAIGFFCLFPPTRALIRPPLVTRMKNRVHVQTSGFFGGTTNLFGGFGRRGGPVYDTSVVDSSVKDSTKDTDIVDAEGYEVEVDESTDGPRSDDPSRRFDDDGPIELGP